MKESHGEGPATHTTDMLGRRCWVASLMTSARFVPKSASCCMMKAPTCAAARRANASSNSAGARLGEMQGQAQAVGGGLHLGVLRGVSHVIGIGQVADPRQSGDRLLEHFQTLGHQLPIDCGEPGEGPPGPGQQTAS
jgi:hypothetical protein